MIGTEVRTLLRNAINDSEDFSHHNFGLAVGEDFREMVEGVIEDSRVTAKLFCGVLIASLGGESFAKSLKNDLPQNEKDDGPLKRAILSNAQIFQPQMEFLYWGIQVGRKMAQAEMEALKKLEENELKA
jgi:hypothetical protein